MLLHESCHVSRERERVCMNNHDSKRRRETEILCMYSIRELLV